MALPTKKTQINTSLAGQTVVIYGPPKIGKTTFCSQIPDAIFACTERGDNYVEIYKADITQWEDFSTFVDDLKAGSHPFKNVVVDTVNGLYALACDKICREKRVEYIGDYASAGKGWFMATTLFLDTLSRISSLGYGLWLIAHAEERTIKEKRGNVDIVESTLIRPAIPGKAASSVLALADIVGYASISNKRVKDKTGAEQVVSEHTLSFRPTRLYDAGDRSGYLPERLPLRYSVFEKAFNDGAQKKLKKEAK